MTRKGAHERGHVRMNDRQLLRYSRHILLDEIGIAGQERLLRSCALILGLGGLGSPAALYLAASGVGRLVLCDHDTVDFSNLQRQIIHRTTSVGQPKTASAQATLHEINPEVECVPLTERADEVRLARLVAEVDVVLDCCDNFATRYAVNRVCRAQRTPLVSGAAVRMQGLVAVFDFRADDAPCYHCVFPEDSEAETLHCATSGVFAPLVGMIGAMQAGEALKLLAGAAHGLCGQLLSVDARDMRFARSALRRDPDCPVCGASRLQK